jgi:hypothetical protein
LWRVLQWCFYEAQLLHPSPDQLHRFQLTWTSRLVVILKNQGYEVLRRTRSASSCLLRIRTSSGRCGYRTYLARVTRKLTPKAASSAAMASAAPSGRGQGKRSSWWLGWPWRKVSVSPPCLWLLPSFHPWWACCLQAHNHSLMYYMSFARSTHQRIIRTRTGTNHCFAINFFLT